MTNNNNNLNKPLLNKFNPTPKILPNKEKVSSNINNNMNIKNSSLPIPSPNSQSNIDYNIKDLKENIPGFSNIQIKTAVNNQQNINLDDIDKIISLNAKIENKPNNIKIVSNPQSNIFPINKNVFPTKKENNKIDIGKENLKFISNEISNLFNSSIINFQKFIL